MKPSIGRIVIFHLGDGDDGINNGSREVAAIVTRVWNDICVNLRLFYDGEGCPTEWKTSAELGTQPGQWSWPERV